MSDYPPPPPPPPSQPGGYPGQYGPGPSGHPSGPRAGFWIRFAAALIDGVILGVVSSILRFGFGVVGSLGGILIGFAYYGYFEGGPSGQSVGKRVCEIRVVRAADGGSLGWGTALLRHLCSYLSAIPCGLGYFWMLWDPEKETWHDKLSHTLVVPAAAWPPPPDSFARPPAG